MEEGIEISDMPHHGPKMSSPLVNQDSMTEYSEEGGDSLSSLATSYNSYPLLRGSFRSGPHYMVPVHVDDVGGVIPSSSPVLRPSSGRLVGGKRFTIMCCYSYYEVIICMHDMSSVACFLCYSAYTLCLSMYCM